jgi:hypothetical protein
MGRHFTIEEKATIEQPNGEGYSHRGIGERRMGLSCAGGVLFRVAAGRKPAAANGGKRAGACC